MSVWSKRLNSFMNFIKNCSGKGIYYLQTNSKPIFGKGVNQLLNAIITANGTFGDLNVLKQLLKHLFRQYAPAALQ